MLGGITGGLGNGKTALGVARLYRSWLLNRRIVSNLKLDFPDKSNTQEPEQFELIELVKFMDNQSDWRKLHLNWDEIYINLECRISASSELNRIGSYLILQSRKLDIRIDWTAQLFGSADNRVRYATVESGELIKCIGVFVKCPLIHRKVNATRQCYRRERQVGQCPNLDKCIKTQNFYVKYWRWFNGRWRKYTQSHIEQFFGMYETEQIIDPRESERISAYLSARKKMIKAEMKKQVAIDYADVFSKPIRKTKIIRELNRKKGNMSKTYTFNRKENDKP